MLFVIYGTKECNLPVILVKDSKLCIALTLWHDMGDILCPRRAFEKELWSVPFTWFLRYERLLLTENSDCISWEKSFIIDCWRWLWQRLHLEWALTNPMSERSFTMEVTTFRICQPYEFVVILIRLFVILLHESWTWKCNGDTLLYDHRAFHVVVLTWSYTVHSTATT